MKLIIQIPSQCVEQVKNRVQDLSLSVMHSKPARKYAKLRKPEGCNPSCCGKLTHVAHWEWIACPHLHVHDNLSFSRPRLAWVNKNVANEKDLIVISGLESPKLSDD